MKGSRGRLTRRQFLGAVASAGALAGADSLLRMPVPGLRQPAVSRFTGGAPAAQAGRLELWTFVNTHARWWRAMGEEFQKTHPGFQLDVQEIAYAEMHDKLQVALSTGVGAPDIADIEQGRYGGFLKGEIQLVDLTSRLQEGGYLEQLVESREALYSWKGKIYGIEHALTPVVLYYRADVFEAEGITPEQIETWDDYIRVGKQLSTGDRKMTFLFQACHDLVLRQRGGDFFDANGNVTVDSPLSVEVFQWLLDLRDTHGIAAESPVGAQHLQAVSNPALYGDLRAGRFLSVMGADWYGGFLRDNVPELAGKWRAMPLPAWEKGGRRTSCYGGTGASIALSSRNVELAWEFLKFTMLSPEANVLRYLETKLWPPLKAAWEDPRLHTADPYFGNQDLGQLFAMLGPEVPAQYQSPYRAELNSLLQERFGRVPQAG